MLAPERFAQWLSANIHKTADGREYRYHPRSDSHSKALASYVWDDFLSNCHAMYRDYEEGLTSWAVNFKYMWENTEKAKTIDLAVGRTPEGLGSTQPLAEVYIACELKAVMTEHGKSQPRIFDELSSSHQIVHAGDGRAIAAGLTVVNISSRYISPTRQRDGRNLYVSEHKQPYVTEKMVYHLRGLRQRNALEEVGFDAYGTFVVSCDNEGPAVLWSEPPAPKPSDPDHYETFLNRICEAYTTRFYSKIRR